MEIQMSRLLWVFIGQMLAPVLVRTTLSSNFPFFNTLVAFLDS